MNKSGKHTKNTPQRDLKGHYIDGFSGGPFEQDGLKVNGLNVRWIRGNTLFSLEIEDASVVIHMGRIVEKEPLPDSPLQKLTKDVSDFSTTQIQTHILEITGRSKGYLKSKGYIETKWGLMVEEIIP